MGQLLVIDADTAGRSIVRSRLVDAGHTVRLAEEAGSGIDVTLTGGYDGILVAAQLDEGSTGVDICRNLRGHRELEDTPLIVYSLLDDDETLLPRAYAAGAHAVVGPAEGPQLERVVDASLASRQRVAGLRDRQHGLRHEQRHLVEQMGREGQGPDAGAASAKAGHPDALLLVDRTGRVRWCDRDSWVLLGRNCVGLSLGEIAQEGGLDEFVRGARSAPRQGFAFDLPGHGALIGRPLQASVYPVGQLRAVLLSDRGKREVQQGAGHGIPRQQVAALIEAAGRAFGPDRIPGDGPIAGHLRKSIAARGGDREPLLLSGEPGTELGFLARVLHYQNPGAGVFLEARCAALSPESLEIELFGSSKDGPDGIERPGLLLLAGKGTVLLAGVEALPLKLQAPLLEMLQSRSLRRVGAAQSERVEARLVATTSVALDTLAEQGRFLPELAACLGDWRLEVPPLRNRGKELAGIIQDRLVRLGGGEIDPAAMQLLRQHCWPRNLVELEETLEGALGKSGGRTIQVEHLPRVLCELQRELEGLPHGDRPVGQGASVKPAPWAIAPGDPISLEFYEKQAIVRALHACRGDRLAAARLLRVGKSTLYRKIRQFGIG